MIRNSLRCNEKELAQVANTLPAQKEGVLLKKGPTKGQGYKNRYFRLCGNLLFYFKQDEKAKTKTQASGEPTGMVVLEGCRIERTRNVTSQPYAFRIGFIADEGRDYLLAAHTEESLDDWLTQLTEGSYEFLRKQLCRLRHKCTLLTGVDPFSEEGLAMDLSVEMKSRSDRAGAVTTILRSDFQRKKTPEGSPETTRRFVPSFRKSRINSKSHSTSELLSSLSSVSTLQTVDLCIGCSSLPLISQQLPNSFVEVSLRRASPFETEWVVHAETEVIDGSENPAFFTVIAIPCDPLLKLDVRFTVLAAQNSAAEDQLIITSLGHAECSFEAIIQDVEQRVRLPLQSSNISLPAVVAGSEQEPCIKASILQADEDDRRASVVTKREPSVRQRSSRISMQTMKGKLKPHLSKLFQCRFIFPSTSGDLIRVAEEMGECSLSRAVPISYLKMASQEDRCRINDIIAFGELAAPWHANTQSLLGYLFSNIGEHQRTISELESEPELFFKASIHKKTKKHGTAFLPTNLHVQRFKVLDTDGQASTRNVTTVGAFACHVRGFRQGGLHKIIADNVCWPSFASDHDSAAHTCRVILKKLATMRQQLADLRVKLFKAAANRKTEQFSSALCEISSKVQQTVADCTKSPISGAIQIMKEARTHSATEYQSEEDKGVSSQDWVWDGMDYILVSKWNLEKHIQKTQEQLMAVLGVGREIEESLNSMLAPRNDIGLSQFFEKSPRTGHLSLPRNLSQPNLHRSPSVSLRRPGVFCWSFKILPSLTSLYQDVESLLKIMENSMNFSLVQMDAHYPDFEQVVLRYDSVMSQALAALATSFCSTLWSNVTNKVFLRMLQDIGFLAHFESLLSTQGHEQGMLEDMWFAVRQLNNVTLHIVQVENGNLGEPTLTGSRCDIHMSLPLQESLFDELPQSLRRGDGVRVRTVLFTQGINEGQTLSDLNFVSQHSQIQADINQGSYRIMEEFVQCFRALCIDIGSAKLAVEANILPVLLEQLAEEVHSNKTKNVEMLQLCEEITYRVNGGRITSCKSAKDRTAMAVTLEQCNILRRDHALPETVFQQALDSMRSRGTRLHNCMKNIGHRQYAFNSFQLKCLPAKYCPPPGTYGKKVQT